MDRHTQKVTLFNNVTPVAVTSSTDATPIVVTATAHGFVTGDRVLIQGHATNVAANGIFKVTRIDANTFSLQDEFSGASVAGSGAGAGSGGFCLKAPPLLLCSDFRNIIFELHTAGTTTMTTKAFGSTGKPDSSSTFDPGNPRKDVPNIGATISGANPYSALNLINLDTGASLNGSTGVVQSGADVNNQWEVNINLTKWMAIFPISWSQGSFTIIALLTSNL